MARYALPADLARLGLPASALGGISSDDQQAALDSASDTIDGYLAARFNLPLSAPFTADLVEAACKIGAYNLLSRRGYNPEAGADVNIRLRYQDALKWCEGVAANRIHPQLTDSAPAAGVRPPRVVSRSSRGWE